jgi:hypothetical protein
LLVVLAVLVGSAATGLLLVAIWRHLFQPATAGQPGRKRAAIAACCVMPAAAAPVLAFIGVSDAEAFAALAAVTFVAVGLGILLARRSA